MKQFQQEKSSVESKLFHFAFVALFTFPVLPLQLSAGILIVCTLLAIAYGLRQKERIQRPQWSPLYVFLLVGVTYLLVVPFATDVSSAWYELEKRAGLIAVPVLFALAQPLLSKQLKLHAAISFSTSTALLGAFITFLHFSNAVENHEWAGTFSYFYKLRTLFESYTGVHPTYFGLFAASGLILTLRTKRTGIALLYWGVIGLFCGIGLIISGARMATFAALLACLVMLSIQKRYKTLIVVASCLAVITFSSHEVLIPRVQNAWSVVQGNESEATRATSIRGASIHCGWSIANDHFWTGVGPDGTQAALNYCYSLLQQDESLSKNLNTHNEYLNLFLTFGVWGIVLALFLLFALFHAARKESFTTAFAIIIALILFTENALARQHGVFAISLLCGLFYSFYSLKQLQRDHDAAG